MGRYRLTKEELASIAIKYNSKKEFREKEPYAYNSILHRGLREELCGHMKDRGVLRLDDELAEIASRYDVLKDFREKEQTAYSLIVSRGLLDKLCGRMKRGTISYTDEELEERASKFDVLSEFRNKEKRAYAQICARGLREKLCGHMKRAFTVYTDEKLSTIAQKYHYREEFIKNDSGAYSAARKRGLLDKICSQMEWQRMPHGYWTKERCHKEALKYKTRKEFRTGCKAAVAAAERRGWLDEICNHMKPQGNWAKRMIYVFTFSDGYAYVGLAKDPKDRYMQHIKGLGGSPILPHIQQTGATFEFKTLTDWLSIDIVGQVEDYYIKMYAADGWKMLNRQKGGGLGSLKPSIYTHERLMEETGDYEFLVDFREEHPLTYRYILKKDLYDKYCSKMKRSVRCRHYWTIEKSIEVVPECKSRTMLNKKYPMAWTCLKDAGLLDKFYPQKLRGGAEKLWTVEKSLSVVPLCKTRQELSHRYNVACKTLRKAGLLDKCYPLKYGTLPEDERMKIIASCNTRTELRSKHRNVYDWLSKNHMLDKYFPIKEKIIVTENEVKTAIADSKSRSDLSKRYRRVYEGLKREKQLDIVLPSQGGFTTEEKIRIITNCKTCTELYKKHAGIYRWAKREGILDKYLPPVHKRRTDEERMEILKSCKSRHELNNKYLAVYNWAKERGLLDEYLPVYQKYTDDERMKIIKSSSSRSELNKKSTSAYNWLRDNGLLEEYFPTQRKIYTDEDRIALMKTCRTRTELNEKYRFIYIWAKKNGLLDKYLPQRKANK